MPNDTPGIPTTAGLQELADNVARELSQLTAEHAEQGRGLYVQGSRSRQGLLNEEIRTREALLRGLEARGIFPHAKR